MNLEQLSTWTAREKIIACAFLLEGEGSFHLHEKENTGWVYIKCKMTDEQPLKILQLILGGNLTGPYEPENDWYKPFYIWRLQGRELVVPVLEVLYQFMSPRRQNQISKCLEWHKKAPVKRRLFKIHGTTSMYDDGCRCENCKKVNSEYYKNRRKLLKLVV